MAIEEILGKHLFCQCRDHSTYEYPCGHIESGKSPLPVLKRELYEETVCTTELL